jgi:hypothetical protein
MSTLAGCCDCRTSVKPLTEVLQQSLILFYASTNCAMPAMQGTAAQDEQVPGTDHVPAEDAGELASAGRHALHAPALR